MAKRKNNKRKNSDQQSIQQKTKDGQQESYK